MSVSKLDKLICELCPNGVEYRALGDVCKLITGATPSKKLSSYWNDGTIPWMSSGEVSLKRVWSTEAKITQLAYDKTSTTLVPPHSIVIALAGQGKTRGKVAITEIELCTNQSLCSIVCSNELDYKFLYYYLDGKYEELRSISNGDGSRGGLSLKILSPYKIPVPPLDVQREIVRILDDFTEQTEQLKASLTAELTARKKQYEYYRDKLLTFGDDVPYRQIKDICDIVDYRGKTPTKTSSGVFLVTAKNIRKGYIDYEKSQEYISASDYDDVMRRGIPKIGDVLITTEAPCGNVAQVDREGIALAQRVIKYRPKSEIINSAYLKYVLLGKEFQSKLNAAATGGTVKGIKGSKLHKLTIPVPSIDAQEKVVSLLESFDVPCNDLTSGLPAEIAARQKQYEYYRDKLLTFKELGA